MHLSYNLHASTIFLGILPKTLQTLFRAVANSHQPRSQALSPLPPFVVGRKTLVAAGHVTTQNLGGKKICWAGGVAEYFDCCCGKLCGFQNLEQSLKNYPLYRVRSRILPMKKATLFLPSSKYRSLSFAKKFGSRMKPKISDGYHM